MNKIKKFLKEAGILIGILFLATCVQYTTSDMIQELRDNYKEAAEAERMQEVAEFYRSYNKNHQPIESLDGDVITEVTKKQ
jgi:ABC-type dipeptide/oligopeptide/nickel transport system permease component